MTLSLLLQFCKECFQSPLVRVVPDIYLVEVQEYHMLEMISELLPVIVSQLGLLSYLIISVNLIKPGLISSELIDWLVTNI